MPPTRNVAERSPRRATIALTIVYTADATENRSPISAADTPFAFSWRGTSRLTPPPTRPISTMIAMPARTSSSRRTTRKVSRRDCVATSVTRTAGTANREIVTAAAAIASTMNGVPVPNRSASTPAKTGPIVKPTPATVVAAARAPARRSCESELESHDAPAAQSAPNASPKPARATRSDQKSPASPWPSVASVKRPAEASVTSLAPKRSASTPSGSADTSAARLAAARIAPVSTPVRPNSSAYVGASGTMAIQVSVSSRNSA